MATISLRSRDAPTHRSAVIGATGVRALLLDGQRIVWVTDTELFERPVAEQPSNAQIALARLPISGRITSLLMSGSRIVVATESGLAIYTDDRHRAADSRRSAGWR